MSLVPGKLLLQSLRLLQKFQPQAPGLVQQQLATLRQLLTKSARTAFGEHYNFKDILRAGDLPGAFASGIPFHVYADMRKWWQKEYDGEHSITWPGKTKYFAMSSGTSDSSSKYIPVTSDMIRANRRAGISQLLCLPDFGVPAATFGKSVLMLGGSTSLHQVNGHYEGDMSGISTLHMPSWLSGLYFRPGQSIAAEKEWQGRIDAIVRNAHKWNIGTVCGIPSWVQIVFERITEHHRLADILEIWPDLRLYIHGGVSYEPYKDSFARLVSKPLINCETYMASEGFFAFRRQPVKEGMRLLTDAGIYYEFIPFNAGNFDDAGTLLGSPIALSLADVQEEQDYALVISTCAGAWRYLLGDVIRFTDKTAGEIVIVGRTAQFLNLCGEHVSIDNINNTVSLAAKELGLHIGEFTLAGGRNAERFEYRWYIGCDEPQADPQKLALCLDKTLCRLNDDYRVERQAKAIQKVSVELIPKIVFTDFLKTTNRHEAMSKFPRVLKGVVLDNWKNHLRSLSPERTVLTC